MHVTFDLSEIEETTPQQALVALVSFAVSKRLFFDQSSPVHSPGFVVTYHSCVSAFVSRFSFPFPCFPLALRLLHAGCILHVVSSSLKVLMNNLCAHTKAVEQ